MEMKRASEFTLAELTAFWNQGYTGYFVSITFTQPMMERWMTQGAFDLANSLVLQDEGRLAGFSFLGVRGRRGWVGGFGIAPEYRGRGLGYGLFANHVALMGQLGLDHVQLEVLTRNWAQKVYARAGFRTARTMAVFTGALPVGTAMSAGVGTADGPAAAADLLAHHARLHEASPACWQRHPAYLTALPPAAPWQGIYAGAAGAPSGYIIYTEANGQVRIVEGAAQDDASAADLVAALAARYPGAGVSLLNEPEGSALNNALRAAGVAVVETQYEMDWEPQEA